MQQPPRRSKSAFRRTPTRPYRDSRAPGRSGGSRRARRRARRQDGGRRSPAPSCVRPSARAQRLNLCRRSARRCRDPDTQAACTSASLRRCRRRAASARRSAIATPSSRATNTVVPGSRHLLPTSCGSSASGGVSASSDGVELGDQRANVIASADPRRRWQVAMAIPPPSAPRKTRPPSAAHWRRSPPASPPAVTTSSRILSFCATTLVIGSTPVDIDLLQLLHPAEDAVQLGHHRLDALFGQGDARQFGNSADGGFVDGHGFGLLGVARPCLATRQPDWQAQSDCRGELACRWRLPASITCRSPCRARRKRSASPSIARCFGFRSSPSRKNCGAAAGPGSRWDDLQMHVGVDPEPSPKSKRHICFLVEDLAAAKAAVDALEDRDRRREYGRGPVPLLHPRSRWQPHRNRAAGLSVVPLFPNCVARFPAGPAAAGARPR